MIYGTILTDKWFVPFYSYSGKFGAHVFCYEELGLEKLKTVKQMGIESVHP